MHPPLTSSSGTKVPEALPQIPGYQVLGELGRGGFGIVWKARHRRLDRAVAIKALRPEVSEAPESKGRLEQEARALSRLQHPNLVQLYEFQEWEGQAYLVLEYVEGKTLAEQLCQGPLPIARSVHLLDTLARATGHCHQQGIVHCSLSPSNIMLQPDGEPKILDFWAAQDLRRCKEPDPDRHILGVPGYMAPEQVDIRDQGIGPGTDIYALGVLFFEMLTGLLPFARESAVWRGRGGPQHLGQRFDPEETIFKLIHRAQDDTPSPPSRIRPQVPPTLDRLCLRCLAKEPQERFPSTQELVAVLAQVFPTRPVEPFPYEKLLAFTRGELDAHECDEVRQCLTSDPRWRAHHDSLRYLGLERLAARQDGRDLRHFSVHEATPFCRAVAHSKGEVLLPLLGEEAEASAGWPRSEWDAHADQCVYCRRMRRLMHARRICAENELGADEPLLRDWLLASYYREPLDEITSALVGEEARTIPEAGHEDTAVFSQEETQVLTAPPGREQHPPAPQPPPELIEPPGELTAQLRRDPMRFIEKMAPVVPLMLDRVDVPAIHTNDFLDYLASTKVMEKLAHAPHVRDVLADIVDDFCQQQRLPRSESTRRYLTRKVMDNILWQAVVIEQKSMGSEEEQAHLHNLEQSLKEQLRAGEEPPEPRHVVETALAPTRKPEGARARMWERLEREFEVLRR
jgi:serine/threonine protein kinase